MPKTKCRTNLYDSGVRAHAREEAAREGGAARRSSCCDARALMVTNFSRKSLAKTHVRSNFVTKLIKECDSPLG